MNPPGYKIGRSYAALGSNGDSEKGNSRGRNGAQRDKKLIEFGWEFQKFVFLRVLGLRGKTTAWF